MVTARLAAFGVVLIWSSPLMPGAWSQKSATDTDSFPESTDAGRLLSHLLQGYSPLVRPVRNRTEAMRVGVGMALTRMVDVHEREQTLTTQGRLRLSWTDYQLRWEPSDHGGLDSLRLPPDRIWTPDVGLLNAVDSDLAATLATVSAEGKVTWDPAVTFNSVCNIDVEYFPFDQQHCPLKLGTRSFGGREVRLELAAGFQDLDTSEFMISAEWELIGCPGYLQTPYADDEGQGYVVVYEVRMRRRVLFFATCLVVPCVLLAVLNLAVFAAPAASREKMAMAMLILFALLVFLSQVTQVLPPSGLTLPLMSKYILFCLLVNVTSVLLTVCVLNCGLGSWRGRRMPRWVRVTALTHLARALCLKPPQQGDSEAGRPLPGPGVRVTSSHRDPELTPTSEQPDPSESRPDPMPSDRNQSPGTTSPSDVIELAEMHLNPKDSDVDVHGVTPETLKVIEDIHAIAAHFRHEAARASGADDWVFLAAVIDRLLLCVFLVVTVCGTLAILLAAPRSFG